ncbi:MAG: AAA family ATPase [Acidimicrobiia bacterium]
MRFIVKAGADPIARADATLLSALGLPGGGAVKVGRTHCRVSAGEVPSPSTILLGPIALANAGLNVGDTAEVLRAPLAEARRVELSGGGSALDTRHLSRSLQGLPVTVGDTVVVSASYGDRGDTTETRLQVTAVEPATFGLVGNGTLVYPAGSTIAAEVVEQPEGAVAGEGPTTAEALLAGLATELDLMTGWLSLLTSAGDLPAAWGLPKVAGVLLSGPAGCGKSEIVASAAERVGAKVHEVSLELVFKPEGLLDRLEKAVNVPGPAVVFVDRLDAIAGDDAMFRTQMAAIMRWFLDTVAEKPRLACVLGTSSATRLPEAITTSPLLPRTLTIPPPDTARRALLFEAALRRVPTGDDLDYGQLANRSAGFSGADVLAAVVQASAMIATSAGTLTQDHLLGAIGEITPSLGSTGLGEMPTSGFEQVANLEEVKQRLTESVIWQMREPERFSRLGIEPPRGILLYGPPGTGKTFVIRALAHEAGAAFFTIKGAELLDKWVGESERAVREIFARARAVAPSILFFDEIDALAPVRGRSTNNVTDSVVAALLTEMDGVTERGNVFVIGATNRRDLVDPALIRAGRLETHLYLGLPEASARKAFFDIGDIPFAGDVSIERLVEATEGYSFADLSGMMREAALQALRGDSKAIEVTNDDLDRALENILPATEAGGG